MRFSFLRCLTGIVGSVFFWTGPCNPTPSPKAANPRPHHPSTSSYLILSYCGTDDGPDALSQAPTTGWMTAFSNQEIGTLSATFKKTVSSQELICHVPPFKELRSDPDKMAASSALFNLKPLRLHSISTCRHFVNTRVSVSHAYTRCVYPKVIHLDSLVLYSKADSTPPTSPVTPSLLH